MLVYFHQNESYFDPEANLMSHKFILGIFSAHSLILLGHSSFFLGGGHIIECCVTPHLNVHFGAPFGCSFPSIISFLYAFLFSISAALS